MLIGFKPARGARFLRHFARDYPGIFHRHGSALRHERQHRMGRIAQKGDAAINPARQWRAVNQSPTIKRIGLAQQAGGPLHDHPSWRRLRLH